VSKTLRKFYRELMPSIGLRLCNGKRQMKKQENTGRDTHTTRELEGTRRVSVRAETVSVVRDMVFV
jgi:hypothetical protein